MASNPNNPNRERDLVLAPNEYAYISDQTKGHIIAYVGPYKTSMANTDQPVFFDESAKRFICCNLEDAIKTFTTVPEGWYVTLKNPPIDHKQPTVGTANNLPNLEIGRKINIPGPTFFSLWPGQMVKVIKGHRLRTNQYLLVRIYEEEQAKKNWKKAVIMPQKVTGLSKEDNPSIILEDEVPNLPVGKLLVVKGTSVSFYIPPTGVEVVPELNGNYVRKAVTLERLEYCILLDENGKRRYIQGPELVIPEPTENFFVKNGINKFKAIELNENSGIYVKVIAPYEENGKKFNIGDELFITGKEQMIYFPRQEHALIKDGERDIYNSVAIPTGEGRYFLNRKTGEILLKKGPCMFLPDPREAVIVQRILTPNQSELLFPGNITVKEHNRQLSEISKLKKSSKAEGKGLQDYVPANQVQQVLGRLDKISNETEIMAEIASDEFIRSQTYNTARTITLDTKFQGAVTIDVWTGYAMLVTGKSGQRKVVVGPQTYLLEYDENPVAVELSTGTPKTDEKTMKSVYLRVLHNKVSDIVQVETKDLCEIEISLSYRVNFTGQPEHWFNVENYVKFLTDHLRSKIRNFIQKVTISEFYNKPIDMIRDIILGASNEKNEREPTIFKENGMQIYDVEILGIELLDDEISDLLKKAQHDEVKQSLDIKARQNEFDYTKQNEEIKRKISEEVSTTKNTNIELLKKETEIQLSLTLTRLESDIEAKQKNLDAKLAEQEILTSINTNELDRERAINDLKLEISQKQLEQALLRIKAEIDAVTQKAQAVSPDLIAALQSFGDKALAEKMAESMAPLSIIGGKSIAEVFANLLKGTVLENVLAQKNVIE